MGTLEIFGKVTSGYGKGWRCTKLEVSWNGAVGIGKGKGSNAGGWRVVLNRRWRDALVETTWEVRLQESKRTKEELTRTFVGWEPGQVTVMAVACLKKKNRQGCTRWWNAGGKS